MSAQWFFWSTRTFLNLNLSNQFQLHQSSFCSSLLQHSILCDCHLNSCPSAFLRLISITYDVLGFESNLSVRLSALSRRYPGATCIVSKASFCLRILYTDKIMYPGRSGNLSDVETFSINKAEEPLNSMITRSLTDSPSQKIVNFT